MKYKNFTDFIKRTYIQRILYVKEKNQTNNTKSQTMIYIITITVQYFWIYQPTNQRTKKNDL